MSYIDSWIKKVKLLSTGVELPFDDHLFPAPFYLFRGESKKWENPVSSNLLRQRDIDDKDELEYYCECFNEIYYPEKAFNSDLNLRFICFLQHNGFKTRLIDITNSLNVALYFAVNDHPDENGYIFKIFGHDILSIGQDLDFADISSLFFNDEFPDPNHYLIKDAQSHFFYRDTNPYNFRLRRQQGWHLFKTKNYSGDKFYIFKYTITPVDKIEILKELNDKGISENFLFPDIKTISNRMGEKY